MPYTTSVAGTVITSSWANTNVRDQVVTPFTNAAARTSAISAPVEGMVAYLADVNRYEFYNGAAWQPVAGVAAKVVRSGDQSITTGTITPVEWQTVVYDAHGFWNGANPERLTAPWPGFYLPSATISWASSNLGVFRRLTMYVNGTAEDAVSVQLANTADTNPLRQNIAAAGVKLATSGFVEVRVTHDAGSARTIDAALCNFRMAYLGPVN
jgi:hypothetical protein